VLGALVEKLAVWRDIEWWLFEAKVGVIHKGLGSHR
jgi:hypothetical protein